MMRSLLLVFMLSIGSTAASSSEPAQSFFDGLGRPTYERQELPNGTIAHIWENGGEKGSFQVVFQRSEVRRAVRYDGTIALALQNSRGTLESSSQFVMEDNTGLDVIIKLPDGDMVLRMRVVADSLRELRLTHIGPRNNPFAAEVEKFFASARFPD
jgi:hypothetical protein